MALTDVTNTLIANISSTEQSTSNVPINRSTGNPAFASNVGQFSTYVQLNAGVTILPFPITVPTQIYIKNIDPAATVIVSWFPTGQALNIIAKLFPGDQIIYWSNPANNSSVGVAQISLNASNNMLIEYFLGG